MHTLRLTLAAAIGALALLVAPAGAGTDGTGAREISSRAALGRGIVGQINALRAKHGLPRLAVSRSLARSARKHSLEMAYKGFFSHQSPSRGAFGERVKREYQTKGYRSWRAGENLLWASPDIDAQKAVELWLKSPRHRQILLTPAWREIGLSAVHTASAPRVFEGLEVTIVTADFGVRAK